MKTRKIKLTTVWLIWLTANVWAQTSAFNYQGKLNDNNAPANGTYEMQFKLFDALTNGNQIGAPLTIANVTVTNGIFGVLLDFGANAFTGANRFLEVSVRRTAGEQFTVLAPRTQILTAPYSIRSNSANVADNANQLGGIPASEYVTNSSVGSTFVRNGTTPQTANFNISGSGFVGGSLGVGTTNIQSPLSVFSASGYGITHTNGTVTLGTYIGSGGTGWIGTRSNHPLYFFTNDGGAQMTLNQLGNVGIGNFPAQTRLFLNAGPLWTSAGWMGSLGFLNGSSIGWSANTGGQHFAIGQTNGGLYFFRTNSDFGNTANPANYDMIISDAGNVGIGTTSPNTKLFVEGGVGQSAASYGLPKFMMLVRNNVAGSAFIEKCYNAVGATATVPCGILSMNQPGGSGPINIRFPFRVTDRFFSMTLINASPVSQSFSVTGFDASDLSGQTVSVIAQADQDFYLLVF